MHLQFERDAAEIIWPIQDLFEIETHLESKM